MDQINTPKNLISLVHFDTGDDIPLDYEKTSEFRHIEKLVKKINKSRYIILFDKCRECCELFHDCGLGSYCEKHILNRQGCCRNHCCFNEGAGHCIFHCVKK